MSSAAITAVKRELTKALTDGSPILAGLWDLSNYVSFSTELNAQILTYTKADEHRKVFLQRVLEALAALEADGYPVVPMAELEKNLYDELRARIANILAAMAKFEALPQASKITATFGDPVDKLI